MFRSFACCVSLRQNMAVWLATLTSPKGGKASGTKGLAYDALSVTDLLDRLRKSLLLSEDTTELHSMIGNIIQYSSGFVDYKTGCMTKCRNEGDVVASEMQLGVVRNDAWMKDSAPPVARQIAHSLTDTFGVVLGHGVRRIAKAGKQPTTKRILRNARLALGGMLPLVLH